MYKHLFKLIWNKKKQNFLFLSEILVSFLVIFILFSLLVYFYQNYRKTLGINDEQVWTVSYSNAHKIKNADSVLSYNENLRSALKSIPQVLAVSFSGDNIPFSRSTYMTSVTSNGKNYGSLNFYKSDVEYAAIFKLKMLEGRWYIPEDAYGERRNLVINRKLKEEVFGNKSAIGKTFSDNDKMVIIGVTEDMKERGDYYPAGKAMYRLLDTASVRDLGTLLIRVSPDAGAVVEGKIYKTLSGIMVGANIEIKHVSDLRNDVNGLTKIPMIIGLIVAGFLIINVALGLFGVLWYNINKRKGEIGLRRAIGASGKAVAFQIVTESLILATIALIAGCFFAIQFPLLHVYDVPASVYLIAMCGAAAFIYLLVLLCSIYPGSQAAAIQPAIALHEE